jgi:valyl-tRNA synthetase
MFKVTPAHDMNEKTLGREAQPEIIDIFNEDATMNSFGLHYQGKDRFVVREEAADRNYWCFGKNRNAFKTKVGI